MDSKTREKILHRCEILTYMGDDGISCIYDQLPDDEGNEAGAIACMGEKVEVETIPVMRERL